METISLLWTTAPSLVVKLLCLALVVQMVLTLRVYTTMAKARVTAGKAKRITADMYKATDGEPEDLRVLTRAVANQFELPVMFYALVVAGLAVSSVNWITVILAWAFVVFRYVHTQEMITQNRVLIRRKMFIRCMQVFILMMIEFAISVLFWV